MSTDIDLSSEMSSSFVASGTGKPVLIFLHYFSGAAISWQWVVSQLEADFCCLSIDRPIFGNTSPLQWLSLEGYANFVWKTLAELAIDNFVLIGHSMGAKLRSRWLLIRHSRVSSKLSCGALSPDPGTHAVQGEGTIIGISPQQNEC